MAFKVLMAFIAKMAFKALMSFIALMTFIALMASIATRPPTQLDKYQNTSKQVVGNQKQVSRLQLSAHLKAYSNLLQPPTHNHPPSSVKVYF